MTLIIGIICDDGVVMAADSASTDLVAQVKQPVANKLVQLAKHKVVVGGSGNVGLLQSIRESLDQYNGAATSVKNVRRDLKALILPHQRQAVADHIPLQMPGLNQPPTACLLAGGFAGKTPFLVEFEANGEDTSYDGSLGNFAAIGSGKTYAHALFRPHLTRKRDLQLGRILAYRVMSDSIDLSHFGLAQPVHVWEITQDGVTQLLDEDKQKLAATIDVWRELEGDALGKLLNPARPPEPALPSPDEVAREAHPDRADPSSDYTER